MIEADIPRPPIVESATRESQDGNKSARFSRHLVDVHRRLCFDEADRVFIAAVGERLQWKRQLLRRYYAVDELNCRRRGVRHHQQSATPGYQDHLAGSRG